MTVDDIYRIIKLAVAKNNQQGYVSPADFNIAINTAQRSYLDFLKGEYERFQVQRPISVVSFSQNQTIRTSLSPLVYSTFLSVNNITGIASFPYDFEFTDAMWSAYNFYNIRFTQQDRQSAWYRSSIDPITTNPIYLIKHEGFQFYPETVGLARLSYIRTPPSITWGYTSDGNGRPVYNPATSQQPVWAETDMLSIIVRALELLGTSLQLGAVIQYSKEIKQIGQ